MATLNLQQIELAGLTPTFTAADAAGDSFANDGSVVLYVKNGDASPHDVTLNVQKSINIGGIDITLTNPSVTVPAGSEEMIGKFDKSWFNDNDDNVTVTYDAVTSVEVAALQF